MDFERNVQEWLSHIVNERQIPPFTIMIEPGPALTSLLQGIYGKLNDMTKEIDDLKAAVTAEDTVIQSAIVLINGITDRVAAAVAAALAANPGVDLSPLNDLTTDINAEASALASAVAAQTPVAPTGTSTQPAA